MKAKEEEEDEEDEGELMQNENKEILKREAAYSHDI